MDAALHAAPIELLRLHRSRIRALATRLARAGDVDDVEQEVYAAALERPPKELVALPAWIATTVRNLVAKRFRGDQRRHAREQAAAAPELLPSGDELVARLELEEFLLRCVRELPEPEREIVLRRFSEERSSAAIAAELGLAESTVRARLARALDRLRERLDERTGERRSWVRVLAPWVVGGAGIGAGATGVAVGGAALLVAAAVVVLAASERDAPLPESTQPAIGDAILLAEHAPPPTERAEETIGQREGPAAAESPDHPATAARVLHGETARVELRVVDGELGLPVPEVCVRLVSEDRLANLSTSPDPSTGESRFHAELTPDHYDVGIFGEGFEPVLLPAVELKERSTTDFGTIALRFGTGAIEGRLASDLAPETTRFVELRGKGRSPCSRCVSEPRPIEVALPDPPCCGYGWDRSVVRVRDGRFRFEGLGAGAYFVRTLDDRPRLQRTWRIDLARGERRTFDLSLGPPVWLRLERLAEDGRPFVGAWASEFEEVPAPIHVELALDGVVTGCDLVPDPADLRARIGPPSRLGQPHEEEVWSFAARGTGFRFDRRADTERGADDQIWPAVLTPGFGHLELAAGRTAPNRYFVHDLPATAIVLTASCLAAADEHFTTGPLEVDLADPRQHSLRLTFRRAN